MKKSKEKPYLTPNEVAELLMVSPVTVRQWAQKGLLKAETTPGGHRRFMRSEVERFAGRHGRVSELTAEKPVRILIVDDDVQFTGFLVELFSTYPGKFVVETARDGFDAGIKVQTFQPCIILLDLMMPDLNGVDVCRLLKQNPATRNIRIIAITGYKTQENVDAIINAGAEACLAKPINSNLLMNAIGIRSDQTVKEEI